MLQNVLNLNGVPLSHGSGRIGAKGDALLSRPVTEIFLFLPQAETKNRTIAKAAIIVAAKQLLARTGSQNL